MRPLSGITNHPVRFGKMNLEQRRTFFEAGVFQHLHQDKLIKVMSTATKNRENSDVVGNFTDLIAGVIKDLTNPELDGFEKLMTQLEETFLKAPVTLPQDTQAPDYAKRSAAEKIASLYVDPDFEPSNKLLNKLFESGGFTQRLPDTGVAPAKPNGPPKLTGSQALDELLNGDPKKPS